MTLVEIAISLSGVVILIGLAWALGATRSIAVTEEAAIDRLVFDEPDFRPGRWLIGADGKSAAAISADGVEAAVVFAVGDGLGTRRFRQGAVDIEQSGSGLTFKFGELSLRSLRLLAPDENAAAQWVLRLAGPRI